MTREELEECVGYEVVVQTSELIHQHGVLIAVAGGLGLVDFGDGAPPLSVFDKKITCLGLVARRHQETRVREHLTVLEDPERPQCTCPKDALTATCPRHGARTP